MQRTTSHLLPVCYSLHHHYIWGYVMILTPHELRDSVIRPTLQYLGCESNGVENFLLALSQMRQQQQEDNGECPLYPIDTD